MDTNVLKSQENSPSEDYITGKCVCVRAEETCLPAALASEKCLLTPDLLIWADRINLSKTLNPSERKLSCTKVLDLKESQKSVSYP